MFNGKELGKNMYSHDSDMLLVGRYNGLEYFITDSIFLYMLNREEYESFVEKWNGYKSSKNIPEETIESDNFCIPLFDSQEGNLRKGNPEEIYSVIEEMKDEETDNLIFTGKSLQMDFDKTDFMDYFDDEIAVFKEVQDEYYLLVNKSLIKDFRSSLYKSKVGYVDIGGKGSEYPLKISIDGILKAFIMPIRLHSSDFDSLGIDSVDFDVRSMLELI